ncbi:hypothetical protein FACS189429_5890 [Bacteroidia bacterium]|nr:hypothetical protein FACS189429_5890 [Bacteroidia bacterium]
MAHKWIYFIPVASLTTILLVLLPILASLRSGEDAEESSDIEQTTKLVFNQLNIKLNSVGYTSVLIENDGMGFAGIKPYVGSLFKFFPRSLWKEKPTPTSFNGEISGTPARRIPYLMTGEEGVYNVGTAPGLVALWHGWHSVILSALLSVMFLWILCKSLSAKSLIVNAIGFMLFYFPQLVMTPATGDNIIQKLLEALIIILLLLFSGVLTMYKIEKKEG